MASELADGTQVYSISPQKTGEYCTYIATALVHLETIALPHGVVVRFVIYFVFTKTCCFKYNFIFAFTGTFTDTGRAYNTQPVFPQPYIVTGVDNTSFTYADDTHSVVTGVENTSQASAGVTNSVVTGVENTSEASADVTHSVVTGVENTSQASADVTHSVVTGVENTSEASASVTHSVETDAMDGAASLASTHGTQCQDSAAQDISGKGIIHCQNFCERDCKTLGPVGIKLSAFSNTFM